MWIFIGLFSTVAKANAYRAPVSFSAPPVVLWCGTETKIRLAQHRNVSTETKNLIEMRPHPRTRTNVTNPTRCFLSTHRHISFLPPFHDANRQRPAQVSFLVSLSLSLSLSLSHTHTNTNTLVHSHARVLHGCALCLFSQFEREEQQQQQQEQPKQQKVDTNHITSIDPSIHRSIDPPPPTT